MSEGWTQCVVGDVVDQVKRPEPVEPGREYHLLGVRWYAGGPFARETVTSESSKATKLFLLEIGDFIYNRLFAWKGSFGVISASLAGSYVSGEFPAFRTDPTRLLPEYLFLYMSQPGVWDQILLESTGSTATSRNRWKEARFLSLPIELPPVEAQRRIVDIISSIDAAIGAAQETQRSQHVACDALREARVFGAGWPIEKLGEHLSDIDGGRSPVTEGRAPTTGERAVLGLGAVQQARFDASQAKAISDSVEMPDKAVARPGDVLITRSNTPERVGLVAMVPDDVASDLFLSDLTLRLHPRESLDRRYLVEAMSAGSARSMISGMARGTSGSMRKISRELIRSMKLPMPPIEDQRLIAAEVSAVTAVTERTDAVLSKLERLRESTLGALLSGAHEIPESYDRFLEEAS